MRQRLVLTDKINRNPLFTALILCLLGTTLLACDIVPSPGPAPAPTITPAPAPTQSYLHRGKITALFCADTSGSYDRKYFDAGKQLISKSFVSAIQPNQDGVTLYVATINYDPVAPANSLDPLIIPKIADYPAPVQITPYPTVENKFTQQEKQATVDAANEQNISAYNAAMARINQQVKDVTASITKNDVKRLQDWNPPVDDRGTSVFGCLYLVKTRLQITSDIKELFIASDLEDNVNTNLASEVVQTKGLKNVGVHVIYLPGTTTDDVKRADWCRFFHDAGASAVRFDDTATSDTLSDLFNTDLHLSSTC